MKLGQRVPGIEKLPIDISIYQKDTTLKFYHRIMLKKLPKSKTK